MAPLDRILVGVGIVMTLLAAPSPSYAWGMALDSKARGLAHYIMAVCQDLNGESARAVSEYQKSVKYNGSEFAPRFKLGAYYLSVNDDRNAAVQLKAAARISPQESQPHYLLALIYSAGHQYDSAIDEFRRVLQIDPDHSEALNSLGYMYAEKSVRLDEALRMICRAIEIDPANGAYYDSLGWVLYKKGRYTEALMALQKAGDFIEDEILYDHTGDVYNALKEYPQARQYWHKSLDMDPRQVLVKQKIKGLEKWTASQFSHRLN